MLKSSDSMAEKML